MDRGAGGLSSWGHKESDTTLRLTLRGRKIRQCHLSNGAGPKSPLQDQVCPLVARWCGGLHHGKCEMEHSGGWEQWILTSWFVSLSVISV